MTKPSTKKASFAGQPHSSHSKVAILIRSMGRPCIAEALAAVAEQTYIDTQVFVLNASGSEHHSLGNTAPNVQLIEPGRSLSRSQAANLLLESALQSDAQFGLFLDEDDLIKPDHLRNLVACFAEQELNAGCVVAYSNTEMVLAEDEGAAGRLVLSEDWSADLLHLANFIPIHSALFNLEVVRQHQLAFDENLSLLEDWDFWLQLASCGPFRKVDEVTAVYRVYLGQSELSAERDHEQFNQIRKYIFKKHLLVGQSETLIRVLGLAADLRAGLRHELQILANDHEGLQASVARLNDALKLSEAEMEQSKAELAQSKAELMQSKAETEQSKVELVQSKAETEQSKVELAQSRAELAQLQAQLDSYQSYVKAWENSKSYRITAPLRRLSSFVKNKVNWISEVARKKRQRAVRMGNKPNQVDVIIPVYRGLDETRACIESVLHSRKHCRVKIGLLVINDASPEPELTRWLRDHARDNEYRLIENEENLGFVLTVNKGMRESKGDVVLLNSDTEVANDWLDRLTAAAYGAGRPVSSVTPFSNNATICSFPKFCEDNELPQNYSLEQLDKHFAATNPGAIIEVPTAVGFCMYITRASLDDIGLFDEEKFGKGYGEENEFCLRASDVGWVHLHCLDTFVWHKGSVSFGTDVQRERVQEAIKVIDRLYPSYQSDIQQFVALDPARTARLLVEYKLAISGSKRKGLLITHDRAGGVQRSVDETVASFPDIAWFILRPSQAGTVTLELAGYSGTNSLRFNDDNDFENLVSFLSLLELSFVHWHHALGLPARLRSLHKRLEIPAFATLHDFYSVCPQISVTDKQGRYCGEPDLQGCESCLASRPVLGAASVAQWRTDMHDWLAGCAVLAAPSQDCAMRIRNYFPDLEISVVSHLEEVDCKLAPVRTLATNGPLKVAILGGLSKIKGADQVDEVVALAQQAGAEISFRLFGHAYRALHPALEVTGPYEESQLEGMLEEWQPDIVWFPAVCPETYSYTLSTCLRNGLPVVTTNLGAFPERLAGVAQAWVLAWDTSPQEWLRWFLDYRIGVPPQGSAQALPVVESERGLEFYADLYHSAPLTETNADLTLQALRAFDETLLAAPSPSWRTRLVNYLYRLKGHVLLRGIVRRVPTNVQTAIKNWIMGYRP